MTKHEHLVTNEEQSNRIDKLMVNLQSDTSRSKVQSWIEDGYVTVNETTVKTNYKCQSGDVIRWYVPSGAAQSIEPEPISLDIVYEDDDLLVVNKPRGMVVHPSPGHRSGTLVNALLHYTANLSSVQGAERSGIVHRIDKDTSGLLLVAKTNKAHDHLAKQLEDQTVFRQYEAIVHGVIDHATGIIDAPIGRDVKNRQNMAVVDDGKKAITHFRVCARYPAFTHLSLQLETGRTHQIRVHLKYINHPVAGDPKYGLRKTLQIGGQALHASSIGFEHPVTQEWMQFEQSTPPYFQTLLEQLPNMS